VPDLARFPPNRASPDTWAACSDRRPFFLRFLRPRSPAMLYFAAKAAISGLLIAIISEVSRRNPGWGGLIASLPLVSVLAMIWLWRDTHDVARIADQSMSTFWFVLPSLPLFLILPLLIRSGLGFWLALGISCAVTMALYAGMAAVSLRLGVRL
jgi:hypothetical protein